MTDVLDGQVSLCDLGIWSGKMSPEPSVQTEEKTSAPSLKKSSKSQSRKLPVCLCLRKGDGRAPDASTMSWESGVWPGEYTMLSGLGSPSVGNESAFLLTSTELQRRGLCLNLNISERPRVVIQTKLSQILERNPDPKYNLSAKACLGILNRAEKRGKKLPEALERALREQAGLV